MRKIGLTFALVLCNMSIISHQALYAAEVSGVMSHVDGDFVQYISIFFTILILAMFILMIYLHFPIEFSNDENDGLGENEEL